MNWLKPCISYVLIEIAKALTCEMEWCFVIHLGDGAVVQVNANECKSNIVKCDDGLNARHLSWMYTGYRKKYEQNHFKGPSHPLNILTTPCVVFVSHITPKRSIDVTIWCAEMLGLIMHRSKEHRTLSFVINLRQQQCSIYYWHLMHICEVKCLSRARRISEPCGFRIIPLPCNKTKGLKKTST